MVMEVLHTRFPPAQTVQLYVPPATPCQPAEEVLVLVETTQQPVLALQDLFGSGATAAPHMISISAASLLTVAVGRSIDHSGPKGRKPMNPEVK